MVRILVFLFAIGLLALGLGLLLEQPGALTLTWFGYRIETSPVVGLSAVALTAIALWSLFSFLFNFPSLLSLGARPQARARPGSAFTGHTGRGIGRCAQGAKGEQRGQKAAAA